MKIDNDSMVCLIIAILFLIKSDTTKALLYIENNENNKIDKTDKFLSKFYMFVGLMYLIWSIFA